MCLILGVSRVLDVPVFTDPGIGGRWKDYSIGGRTGTIMEGKVRTLCGLSEGEVVELYTNKGRKRTRRTSKSVPTEEET